MKIFLALLLALGILLPKASAALALILPTYGSTITICTPDGIRTVTLDASGTPVGETDAQTAPCLMAHATLVRPATLPDWHRLARQIECPTALKTQTVRAAQTAGLPPPCRAPPFL
ncbi:hypothetical protein HKX54_07645 [Sulfitobacter sp. M57]|nr:MULTISPECIES: hypothetical protein [unclassified Sulfitobacter]MDF3432872.1 hypothetical protein [Sulfitobacter sp. KE42]MDF3462412.1 hypothetical protein [Sulfitobacter sp. Ks18]MDF3509070.1 hypothetical protein [Sulfitobacter sp. M57]MDF3512968.1 hypothetical protein [Sulfitobacter sp. M36]MDF3540285.1 hypothetical protein [Sulfitobacter sp. M62]